MAELVGGDVDVPPFLQVSTSFVIRGSHCQGRR